MSIVSVDMKWSGRNGEIGRSRRAVKCYDVVTDDPADGEDAVLAAVALPLYGQAYSSAEPYLKMRTMGAESAGPMFWHVTVNYAQSGADRDKPEPMPKDEALAQPPEIEWDYAVVAEAIDREVEDDGSEGDPIVNTADEPFDPPLTEDKFYEVCRITQNVATYAEAFTAGFAGAVSTDTWEGYAAGRCKVKVLRATQIIDGAGEIYWKRFVEIQCVPNHQDGSTPHDGWDRRVANLGYREKTHEGDFGHPGYKKLQDTRGEPIGAPAPLDDGIYYSDLHPTGYHHGWAIAPNQGPIVWLYWQTCPRAAFSGLNLPAARTP